MAASTLSLFPLPSLLKCSSSHPNPPPPCLMFRTSAPPNLRTPSSTAIRALSSPTLTQDNLKKLAIDMAVNYVRNGMVLGLSTGSTATFVVSKIGELFNSGQLRDIVGIPTSKCTAEQATSLGIPLSTLNKHPNLDLAIDGADEVDSVLDLVKGRGGALLREKMVAATSSSFVVVTDKTKLVSDLGGSSLKPLVLSQGGVPSSCG